MKLKLLMLGTGTVAAAVAVILAGGLHSPPAQGATAPALTPTQVGEIARGAAAQDGEASPTAIQYVSTTRRAANLLLYGTALPAGAPTSRDGSDLVVERGAFTLTNVPRPYGAPAPSGRVLVLVVNSMTGDITDIGAQAVAPTQSALRSLGAVTNIASGS